MTKHATICVGTLGQGIWRSSDGGDTWLRVRHGLYSESAVRALAVHPSDARIMYCGADSGIYRSEDKGERWERLDSPMNESPSGPSPSTLSTPISSSRAPDPQRCSVLRTAACIGTSCLWQWLRSAPTWASPG